MMEKNDFDHLKSILNRGSELKAPSDMAERVLAGMKLGAPAAIPVEPVIPTWVWWLLGLLMLSLVFWTLSSPTLSAAEPSRVGQYLEGFSQQFASVLKFKFNFAMVTACSIMGFMLMVSTHLIDFRMRQMQA